MSDLTTDSAFPVPDGGTLDITREGGRLQITVNPRARWPFLRPQLKLGTLILAFLAFAVFILTGGLALFDGRAALGFLAYFAGIFVFLMGAAYYQSDKWVRESSLLLDTHTGTLRLTRGDDDVREYPLRNVQLLQLSEMTYSNNRLVRETIPPSQQWELTLVTDQDIEVLGSCLDRKEAEEAVRLFDEAL